MKQFFFLFLFVISVSLSAQVSVSVSAPEPPILCREGKPWMPLHFNPGRMPAFPNGDSALQRYVREHLVVAPEARDKVAGNNVCLVLLVDTAGKIMNPRVERLDKAGYEDKNIPEANEAVKNLICGMPDWIPGGDGVYGQAGSHNYTIEIYICIHFWGQAPGTAARWETFPLTRGTVTPPPAKAQGNNSTAPNDSVVVWAEEMPEFPGGVNALSEFLKTEIVYPNEAKEKNKQGLVLVQFTVEKDGSLSNIVCVKGIPGAPELDQEAIRVIGLMPKWKPGKNKGKPVRVVVTQPIRFILVSDKKTKRKRK